MPNVPLREETFEAIAALARAILDPIRDRYGAVEITYGFAGPPLTRHVPGRISPPHDQHAGHELDARARPVCARGGQACDLRVPGVDSLEVAGWVRASLPFDRMYLYAPDRALHVSHAAAPAGAVFAMRAGGRGTVPCNVTRKGWDEVAALLAPRGA